MPERFRIVGAARSELDDEEFRELAREAVDELRPQAGDAEAWERVRRVAALRRRRRRARRARRGDRARRASELGGDAAAAPLPLAAAAGAPPATVEELGELGLGEGARVITEKPFGTDLASARELERARCTRSSTSSCIFRIDHYLGREAVQNLLALRFANGMFEPVWNRNHIDHVQIDVPETLSIEMRGSFYEETGAFRDMVVTHLFQVLGFVAMEPPTSLDAEGAGGRAGEGLRRRCRRCGPSDVVRGQYAGYRDEEGVAPDSDTETFVAVQGLRRQLALGGGAVLPAHRASAWPRAATC